jgi:NADP-dependent 3-hydroxy acid dehydrogenase YdfG
MSGPAGDTAVVTGAASGIGRALARRAARAGLRLALCDVDAAGLSALAAELVGQGAAVITRTVDVRDRAALESFASAVPGRIALVFANAGVLRVGLPWTLPQAEVELMLAVNLGGVLNTLSAFVPRLSAQDGPSRVVITGSRSGFVPTAAVAVYAATKNAVWSLAETLQQQMDAEGGKVGVSLLAPGGVRTGLASSGSGLAAGARRSAAADLAQQQLGQVLEAYGADPDAIAEQTFEAIAAGRFWVLPDPTFKPAFAARAAAVTEEGEPGR